MNNFLKDSKIKLRDVSDYQPVTLIMGNEACDLDSAVSSLVYAYFLQWVNQRGVKNNDIFLPFLNIPTEDFPLKTEVVYLFKKYNINLNELLGKDGLDLLDLSKKCDMKFVLVDHHILSDAQTSLLPFVTTILDHRPKDNLNWHYNDSVKVNLQIVGSCTTLVCSEIIDSGLGKVFFEENREAGFMLYETITLDTVNFLPSADRARPLDFQMVEQLENILEIEHAEVLKKDNFKKLLSARIDTSNLTCAQLLRRDLKIINNFPIPGLPLLVKDFLVKSDCKDALNGFCQRHNASTILIMGLVIVDDKVVRDLAVYSVQKCDLHEKIVTAICDNTDPSLDVLKSDSPIENCDYFEQRNTKASRKQIIPIVRSVL